MSCVMVNTHLLFKSTYCEYIFSRASKKITYSISFYRHSKENRVCFENFKPNICAQLYVKPLQIKPLIKSLFQFPAPRITSYVVLGVGNWNRDLRIAVWLEVGLCMALWVLGIVLLTLEIQIKIVSERPISILYTVTR